MRRVCVVSWRSCIFTPSSRPPRWRLLSVALLVALVSGAGRADALSIPLAPAVDGSVSRTDFDVTTTYSISTSSSVLVLGRPVSITSSRPVLEFDLSALPPGASILSATLELVTSTPESVAVPLGQNTQLLSGYAGDGVITSADFQGTMLQSFLPSDTSGGLNALDVTAFVQGLPSGAFAGFVLSNGPVVAGPGYQYYASEASNPALRPRLVVQLLPEASTGLLLVAGLAGLARCRRRAAALGAGTGWLLAFVGGLLATTARPAAATVIAEYTFTGSSLASSDSEPGSVASPLSLSSAASVVNGGNPAPGLNLLFGDTSTPAANTWMATLTLTPTAGATLDLSALRFDGNLLNATPAGGGIAPFYAAVRSNLDGFASEAATAGWTARSTTPGYVTLTLDLSAAAFQGLTAANLAGLGGALELALYFGTYDPVIDLDFTTIDNIVVEGSVAVPEPGMLALLAATLLFVAARRRTTR